METPKYLYRVFSKKSKMFISLCNISYFSNINFVNFLLKEYHIKQEDVKIIKYKLTEIGELKGEDTNV